MSKRLLHNHKAEYDKKMRHLADNVVLGIIRSPSYRDSPDAPYRHWWRMANVEAHRRGLT